MSEHEKQIIAGVREMAQDAPKVGLCSLPFKILADEIERIIAEREALRQEIAEEQKNENA